VPFSLGYYPGLAKKTLDLKGLQRTGRESIPAAPNGPFRATRRSVNSQGKTLGYAFLTLRAVEGLPCNFLPAFFFCPIVLVLVLDLRS
jgi:hypothetical protein